MRGLRGKRVIVTGAASGIGRATAARFGEEGCDVVLWDRDGEGAQAAARAIGALGGTAHAAAVDITDYAAVGTATEAVVEALGPIDVLVNNAGWDRFAPFLDTEPDLWERLVAVNLLGPIHVHHAVLPHMRAAGRGRVVNVASDAARVGSSGEAVYAACKAGVVALTKTLAREHARDGLTFNVVCPGPTRTPLFEGFLEGAQNPEKLAEAFRRAVPLGRLGEPGDLPGAIAFFASDDAGYITGQVLSVSGGLTMSG